MEGLPGNFSNLQQSIPFMDVTIYIEGNKIETDLFEKPLSLHLYIPPKSCHPPQGFRSLVYGMTLRIHKLCSREKNRYYWLKRFYIHLRERGFHSKVIVEALKKAIFNAKSYMQKTKSYLEKAKSKKMAATRRKLIFHLQYHPNDPQANKIQRILDKWLFNPTDGPPLNHLTNYKGEKNPIDGMLVAYSRAPNIGNLLSYRKINKSMGPKVSSHL